MLTFWSNDCYHLYLNALLKRDPRDWISGESLMEEMGTLDHYVGF